MKTMYYTNGQQRAEIDSIQGQSKVFYRASKVVDGKRIHIGLSWNFWKVESYLINLGYKGEKDAEYKGIAIRWRERGIHNTMDAIYKDGYYMFLPPFPGTIFYDAATIEEAKAEIDRLENLSKI